MYNILQYDILFRHIQKSQELYMKWLELMPLVPIYRFNSFSATLRFAKCTWHGFLQKHIISVSFLTLGIAERLLPAAA
jgi:hypothetical protein